VEEIMTASYLAFHTNAINLQTRQAQFLLHTATCLIQMNKQRTKHMQGILATLQKIGSQIPSPGHTTQQLFHMVSPMVKKEG